MTQDEKLIISRANREVILIRSLKEKQLLQEFDYEDDADEWLESYKIPVRLLKEFLEPLIVIA